MNGPNRIPRYGSGTPYTPNIPCRNSTKHDWKVQLEKLLPLEEYDQIIAFASGGKDSVAIVLLLLELGVPVSRITLWHHCVDGRHQHRRMDWPPTRAYLEAFATRFNLPICYSYRERGFFGELYRIGAPGRISFELEGNHFDCPLTPKQEKSYALLETLSKATTPEQTRELEARLRELGQVLKFPAVGAVKSGRWCTPQLKSLVGDKVLRTLYPGDCADRLDFTINSAISSEIAKIYGPINILVVSGERREESYTRKVYNEIELHSTHAPARLRRNVHHWRPVIDWNETQIWEIHRRHGIGSHPSYLIGWGRCSCMCCVFSTKRHWAGIRELFPDVFQELCNDERRLNFTIRNGMTLEENVGDTASCVFHHDTAIQQALTGCYDPRCIFVNPQNWRHPAGAFQGAAGGPC